MVWCMAWCMGVGGGDVGDVVMWWVMFGGGVDKPRSVLEVRAHT